MKAASRRIANAFEFIGEVFDDLSYAEGAIRAYKREVEKLERAYM